MPRSNKNDKNHNEKFAKREGKNINNERPDNEKPGNPYRSTELTNDKDTNHGNPTAKTDLNHSKPDASFINTLSDIKSDLNPSNDSDTNRLSQRNKDGPSRFNSKSNVKPTQSKSNNDTKNRDVTVSQNELSASSTVTVTKGSNPSIEMKGEISLINVSIGTLSSVYSRLFVKVMVTKSLVETHL
jgi:hypothetical protein